VEVDGDKMFSIINARAAPSIISVVLNHVDKEVDDTGVVVSRLKAEHSNTTVVSSGL